MPRHACNCNYNPEIQYTQKFREINETIMEDWEKFPGRLTRVWIVQSCFDKGDFRKR